MPAPFSGARAVVGLFRQGVRLLEVEAFSVVRQPPIAQQIRMELACVKSMSASMPADFRNAC